MEHILIQLLSALTPLNEAEKADIRKSFPIQHLEKGTFLTREGQREHSAYYVVQGCIRAYHLLEGEEKTTAFYTENQSVVNFESLAHQTPSKINLVCNEDSTVVVLQASQEQALYQKYPRFETFCRKGMEQMMGQHQAELVDLIALKPEQRYQKLQAERPDLLQRVPQYQIASYLGVKPETLSRIRARLVKKPPTV